MAQKVSIILVDDIDDSEATETVTFGLDSNTYEIDLNDKNAAQLRDVLALYVGVARKVTGGRRGAKRSAAASGPSASDVRDWARSSGFTVPDRGRIPSNIRDAYDAAH